MEQQREPAEIVQWEIVPAIADESVVARLHLHCRALVLVGVEIRALRLEHQRPEYPRKFREPLHIFNAGDFPRVRLAVFVAFPYLQVFVRLAQKQNLAMLFLGGHRIQQQHAFLLLNAAQVKQVGIRLHRQRAVGVGGQHIVGV